MEALHTPTIMISSFATLVVFAVFFALASRQERNSLELRLWSCAFLVGALGFTLLALRGPGYSFVPVSLGNALAVLGLALIWLGLRAFDNQPLKIASALAGPMLWLLITSFSDYVQSSVTSRIVLFSALIFVYSAMIAVEIFRSDNFRKLPSSYIVAFLFATHGLFYLVRIPLIFVWPLFGNTASGAEQPVWYQLMTFELFLHSLAGGFSFFALIKERTQHRYKLASETDALTGVPNRRAFMAKLDAYLATKPAEGALMYMDIDHFKAVNDRYGHATGDKVLIECAAVISQAAGGRAFLARMGGEEFSACFPGVYRSQAAVIAEDIRVAFEQAIVRAGNTTLSATVSIGVAFVGSEQEAGELLSSADRALYAAKAAGRNSVWATGKDGAPRFVSGLAAKPAEPAPSSGRTERGSMAHCA
ncbi:putative diguanylate cyclase YedQ [Ensifer sp. M14]|uniref:GGDEF domain-containing protein n=1 Tax=Ensifer sp. M14 TaxID=2203782 RepID=UPI000E2DFCCA|nr:GGDEF domain-containing protein [Ensifer sp. M14]RDL48875.1 putative diguanylate cyclase YedQ [Ensifer sp. M14]